MEETIKGIEVIAYKGMHADMTCYRDFKFEVGKTYKEAKAKIDECGFHACLKPNDVLYYYDEDNSRYFKVKLSGEVTKCDEADTKVAATEITILEEVTDKFDEICKNVEWWKNKWVLDFLYYQEGFAVIRRGDGLYNFINTKGKYLSDEWFEYAYYFIKGFARVQRTEDRLYNIIDTKGKYLSDEWFYWCSNFSEGFALVQRTEDRLYNIIDTKGKYLSDEWFYWYSNFSEGFAAVQRTNGKWSKIDRTGNLIKNLQYNMATVYLDIMIQDKFYKQLTYYYSELFIIDADEVKAFVLKKLPTLKNKEFTIKFTNNKI